MRPARSTSGLLLFGALLAALTGGAATLRAALPGRVAPACVLSPQAAEHVIEALGYRDDGWQAAGGARVTGIRVEASALRFLSGGEPAEVLVATHPQNLSAEGPAPAWRGHALVVYVAEGATAEWVAAAREVGERLDELDWRCGGLGASTLPAALPWLAWGCLLLGAGLTLWVFVRGGAGSVTRRELAALLLLFAISFALRAARWSPYPLHYIEMERVPPAPKPGAELASALALPLLATWSDGVAAQAALNVGLGTLAPLLLVALGARWHSRPAGWLAGLFLAFAPLQLRFGGCSDASVTLTPLLLGAVLATEVALASGRAGGLIGAGLLWGLVLPLRPDAPIYLVAQGAWLGGDARGRALLRSPARAALLLAPVALGLAVALPGVLARGDLRAPLTGLSSFAAMARAVAASTWDLAFDPRLRPPPETLFALAGLVALRGPGRVFALLAGLALPGLAFSLQGGRPFADTPLALEEAKSALYGQPYWLLAAAALLATPWRLASPWRGRLIPIAALGATALLAASWLYRGTVTLPSPVQAEHAFLARALPALPARAVVVALGHADGTNAPVHVEHRVVQAGRALVDAAGKLANQDGVVVRGEGDGLADLPPGIPVFALRGWLAFAGPDGGRAPLPDGCLRVPTTRHPRTGEDTLPLCLAPFSAGEAAPSRRANVR